MMSLNAALGEAASDAWVRGSCRVMPLTAKVKTPPTSSNTLSATTERPPMAATLAKRALPKVMSLVTVATSAMATTPRIKGPKSMPVPRVTGMTVMSRPNSMKERGTHMESALPNIQMT